MGTNSKAGHQSYTIAPTATASVASGPLPNGAGLAAGSGPATGSLDTEIGGGEITDEVTSEVDEEVDEEGEEDGDEIELAQAEAEELLQAFTVLKQIASTNLESLDPDETSEAYAQLCAAVQACQDVVDQLDNEDSKALLDAEIKAATLKFLDNLTPQQLQQLANQKGFAYPQLVGVSGSSRHPLAFWLDPAYPAGSAAKEKVQAAAQQRFDALCAGTAINGKTLAEWQALYPSLVATTPPAAAAAAPFATWAATPDQILASQSTLDDALANLQNSEVASAQDIAAVLAAENTLATAQCAELANLGALVAGRRHAVDQALSAVPSGQLWTAVEKASAEGNIPSAQLTVLDTVQLAQLLRASTPAEERESLEELAAARTADLTAWTETVDKLGDPDLGQLGMPGSASFANNFLANLAQHNQLASSIATWQVHTTPDGLNDNTTQQTAIATFKEWATNQSLPQLRNFAATHLDEAAASVATKSQLAQYLTLKAATDDASKAAASKLEATLWLKCSGKLQSKPAGDTSPTDANHTKAADMAAKLEAKLLAQYASKPAGDVSPSAGPESTPAASAPAVPMPKSGFGAQHAQLVAALQHAQASHSAVPSRLDAVAVESFDFGAGATATGGSHPKTIHTGPDGATWLAKPEPQPRGGALVAAEVAASAALARAGVPAVPVYAATVAGKASAVQPMLKNTTTISASPTSWTQSDVDAIVQQHVAAWVIGDHDGNADNMLRTASGGIVRCDTGQACKFYGTDELSLSYRPNPDTTVHHRAYDAFLAGSLPEKVTINPAVAHPVIKKIESVPDPEWRALFHKTAHAGAGQSGVEWVPAMRARAAKTHGIPESQVTKDQVANAFLDHAVERKNGLRAAFTAFFTTELKLPSAAALTHLRS